MWQLPIRSLALPMAASTISGYYACRYMLNQPMDGTIFQHIISNITNFAQNFVKELNMCYDNFNLDRSNMTNMNGSVVLDGATLTAISVLSIMESVCLAVKFTSWIRDRMNKPTDEEILRNILNDINELASILRTVEELTDEAYNAFNKAIEVLEKEIENIRPWSRQERNLQKFAWERLTLCRRLFTPLASRYALDDRHVTN